MTAPGSDRPIVFFDGECNLCNGGVQFLIRHDREKKFLFGTLQSDRGKAILRQFSTAPPDSFILSYRGKSYIRSGAALRIFRELGGFWSLLYVFMIVPRFLRDGIYDCVARNRYRWFGKRSECMIPTPELKARFLDN